MISHKMSMEICTSNNAQIQRHQKYSNQTKDKGTSPAFWLLDRIWRPALIGKKLENDKFIMRVSDVS
uniref:Uncharacterized protein n=1 Tax=Solanum lycopersicum TaxID=4081 RepID=A0A3Q7IWX8_SOLLC